MNETVVELLSRNAEHAARFKTRFDEVQHAQHPAVVTVCCSDSRILQDRMWENDETGYIFTCGNIGNRVMQRTEAGDVVSGDVLYPIAHTGTKTAIVVGHTGCGAVTAAYQDITDGLSEPPGITHCIELLKPGLAGGVDRLPGGLTDQSAVNHLVEYNVDRQVEFLRESDDVPEDVTVVGVVYDFQDVYSERRGEVSVINVDGETEVAALRDAHPEIRNRIARVWEY